MRASSSLQNKYILSKPFSQELLGTMFGYTFAHHYDEHSRCAKNKTILFE
ncbi:hypothetical protein HMPREF9406_1792 [Clostridium sp. HGF2]|nr:hypothetical protein HMPREF9406_1792 [Clostridium sp. HGF2]BDE98363.1 hypothetical protein CE91St51_04010 [[Clostridium] innocuum]